MDKTKLLQYFHLFYGCVSLLRRLLCTEQAQTHLNRHTEIHFKMELLGQTNTNAQLHAECLSYGSC